MASTLLRRRRQLCACALLSPLAACGGGGGYSAGSPPPPSPPPAASKWQSLAALADGPRQECGVCELNGEIYVAGGFDETQGIVTDVEAYNVATNAWRRIAALPLALHHVNLAAARGRLYVVGALQGANFAATGVTIEYDPTNNVWSSRTAMPAGTQRGASAVAVIGERIYVAGGARGAAVTDFSFYDATNNAWQTLPSLPVASEHFVAAAVNGVFYAIGGRSSAGLRNEVQIFSPANNQWSSGRPMPTARGGIIGAAVGGRIHVVGGEGNPAAGNGIFVQHEVYDPPSDTWTTLESMRTPRHGSGAVGFNGVLFVPGGATREGFGAVATNESFTP